jgi:nitrogen fixation protein FixH
MLKMKIGWGHKILFVYLGFVAGMLFLVYKANREKFDLVTPDYYEAELKFQNVIEDKQRVFELSAPPKITHSVNMVNIQLPGEFLNKEVKGDFYLYRPSDASKDLRKTFTAVKAFIEIPLDKSLSGAYELKLSWQAGGKTFYNEQRIFF